MVLIDSVYIHEGGGKNILENLCTKIYDNGLEKNFFFLFDSRYTSKLKIRNSHKINSSEINRLKFYKKNKFKFQRFICMSNVPPPVHLNKPVDIYFHNDLLLNPFRNNLTLLDKLKLFVKKHYIKYINSKKYSWNVQTALMKKRLINSYSINEKNINIYPIFTNYKSQKLDKDPRKFLYVSNFSKHKNHLLLFKAFKIVANKINYKIHLDLTLPNEVFYNSFYNKESYSKNLEINNYGILNKSELSKLYSKSNFLIFPSLNESFGLPLIEATFNDCYIISSNKDYVFEIIKPTLTFNPLCAESIASAIFEALNSSSLIKSEVIIENKIDTFVKYISNNV